MVIPLIVAVSISVTNMIGIGQKRFGPLPCGTPVVQIETTLPPTVPQGAPGWVDGISAPNCIIHINSKFRSDMCEVVVHEYGHLAGRGHSPNPHDIMNGRNFNVLPECHPYRKIYVTFKRWDIDDYELWFGIPSYIRG